MPLYFRSPELSHLTSALKFHSVHFLGHTGHIVRRDVNVSSCADMIASVVKGFGSLVVCDCCSGCADVQEIRIYYVVTGRLHSYIPSYRTTTRWYYNEKKLTNHNVDRLVLPTWRSSCGVRAIWAYVKHIIPHVCCCRYCWDRIIVIIIVIA